MFLSLFFLFSGCTIRPPPRDTDLDGYTWDEDCDDSSPETFPGASERCDGKDNDCDGQIDEGAADGSNWFFDEDGDGYAGAGAVVWACSAPSSDWYSLHRDCDDSLAKVYPGASEACNGRDDDCDREIDEHPPSWYVDEDGDEQGTGEALVTCDPPEGFVSNKMDCDDTDPTTYWGAPELCNEVDDDCDGDIDEELPLWFADRDGDFFGDAGVAVASCEAPAGMVSNAFDCDDGDANRPSEEVCDNNVDDDCDFLVDEGCP